MGSEMCIRDRAGGPHPGTHGKRGSGAPGAQSGDRAGPEAPAELLTQRVVLYIKEATKGGKMTQRVRRIAGVLALVAVLGTAAVAQSCLLYTSDAAGEGSSVDLGGRRILKKKKY